MVGEERKLREWNGLVAVGRIARSQGRHGEVAVEPWTDSPERFFRLNRVYLEGEGGEPVPLSIESARIHRGRPVIKLSGIFDIGQAEALRGKELRIPESELEPLPEGSFYRFQIRGLAVKDRLHGEIGVVEDLLETGGTALLVVRGRGGEETLVPLCSEIVRNVDVTGGAIEIEAPEGLLSLNAN
ncbi:MAG: ribosome maturation factor RimM [Vicinamibacteria bacterium]